MCSSIKHYFKFLPKRSEKMLDKIFVFKYFSVIYVTHPQLVGYLKCFKEGA